MAHTPLLGAFVIEDSVLEVERSACDHLESEPSSPTRGLSIHYVHTTWSYHSLGSSRLGGLHGGLGSYSLDPPGFFLNTTTCFTLSSRILAYNSACCYSLIFFVCALYPELSTPHIISFSSDDMLEGGRHYSPQTQNKKIPKCSYPAFCRVKEQHCVLRSNCIQILWFLFSYFPSLCAFYSTCSTVWEKCFICFVLWVANWLGPLNLASLCLPSQTLSSTKLSQTALAVQWPSS